ncbi:hypothetical protein ACRARG_04510 [Pseudooceanicola sp. C21-150M6]|uniref:hypothetical protein n=1 Tax=Pseudooceanicola sp. C21-150M6 TaxID=3434355 RepID=UPI003D7F1C5A
MSGKFWLNNVPAFATITIAQSANLQLISAGVRKVTVPLDGVTKGRPYLLLPVEALPAGYALHHAVASSDDALSVTLTAPLLSLGQSYAITARVYSL